MLGTKGFPEEVSAMVADAIVNVVAASTVHRERLPAHVEAVFHEFMTCEFSTVARDGTPITWPTLPVYIPGRFQFMILTSPGLAQKAFNVRRNPHVSLLYSEPTGSGLEHPPAVLIQGRAESPDEIMTSLRGADPELVQALKVQTRKMMQRQPAVPLYMLNPVSRYLMDWYFMRLVITVTPARVMWWEDRDFSRSPQTWEVNHVD